MYIVSQSILWNGVFKLWSKGKSVGLSIGRYVTLLSKLTIIFIIASLVVGVSSIYEMGMGAENNK